jgi:hypothetical protein
MKNQVIVNGTGFAVKEFKDQRVVTVKEIAKVHQVPIRNVQINYERNRTRFIEGVDYFALKGKKACNKLFVGSNITQINVFTESGYLMLTKSLTDDLSWQVQRELVNHYFKKSERSSRKIKPNSLPVLKMFPLLSEEYKRLLYYRMEKGLSQNETALVMEISRNRVYKMEHSLKLAGLPVPSVKNNSSKYKLGILGSIQQALEV